MLSQLAREGREVAIGNQMAPKHHEVDTKNSGVNFRKNSAGQMEQKHTTELIRRQDDSL